jgi:uncharacterized membrane protein
MTPRSEPDPLEVALGRILRAGVTASSLCLMFGLSAAVAHEARLAGILLTSGMVALLATPVTRVLVSSLGYARQREWVYVALTLVVLMELVASVVAAVHGSRP